MKMVKKDYVVHLKPVLNDILSETELYKIADHLQRKNIITFDDHTHTEKQSLVSSLIDSINSSKKSAKPWDNFIDLLKDLGKNSLAEVLTKFFSSKKDSLIYWLVSHWKQLVICGGALDGLAHYFSGLSHDDFPSYTKWIEIISLLSCCDQKLCKYFFNQLKINISFTFGAECDAIRANCFNDLFKSVFEDCLEKEDCERIAEILCQKSVIQTKSLTSFYGKKNKQTGLLKICFDHYSSTEFLKTFPDVMKKQGLCKLTELLELFVDENNKTLIWLLSYWSKLQKQQFIVFSIANEQEVFIEKKLDDMGDHWLLYIVHALVSQNGSAVDSAISSLRKKFDLLKESLQESSKGLVREIPMEVSNYDTNEEVISENSTSVQQSRTYASVVKIDANNSSVQHISQDEEKNFLIQKHMENSLNISVEFRVVVDISCKIDKTAQLQVLVQSQQDKIMLPLKFDEARNIYFGSFQVSSRTFIYKYKFDDYDGENWENIPKCVGCGIVNREISLFKNWPSKESVILYDVVTFIKSEYKRSDFSTMYSRNMSRHLSPICKISLANTEFMWISCLNEIEMWLMTAMAGIHLDKHCCLPFKIFPTCRTLLEKYLESNSTYGLESNSSSDICKRVLAFLSVMIAAYRLKILDEFKNTKKLIEPLLNGLSLNNVFVEDLETLCSLLVSADSCLVKQAIETIHAFCKKSKNSIVVLKVLPFYYILCNKCSYIYDEKLWKTAMSALKTTDNCTDKEATENQNLAVELAKNFPGILITYQHITPLTSILHMVNENASFIKNFRPLDVLLHQLNSSTISFKNFFGSKKMVSWIYEFFEDFEEKCKDKCFIEQSVDYIGNISKAMNKYIMTSSVHLKPCESLYYFCKIFVKLVSCYSCTIQVQSNVIIQKIDFIKLSESLLGSCCESPYIPVSQLAFQVWNLFLSAKLLNLQMNEQWHNAVRIGIEQILNKKLQTDNQSLVFEAVETLLESEERLPEIETCCLELLFNYALKLKYQDEESSYLRKFFRKFPFSAKTQFFRVVKFFQKLFFESWKGFSEIHNNPIDAALNFAASWPFTAQFFVFFGDTDKHSVLDSKVVEEMEFIVKQLKNVESDLLSGKILFKHLQIICSNRMGFGEVLDIIGNKQENLLLVRQQEMDSVLKLVECLKYFIYVCHSTSKSCFLFDIHHLENFLQTMDNIPWCKIIDLNWKTGEDIDVTYFQLSNELKTIVDEIFTFKIGDNMIIKSIWCDEASTFCIKKNNKKVISTVDSSDPGHNADSSDDECDSSISNSSAFSDNNQSKNSEQCFTFKKQVIEVSEIPQIWLLVKQKSNLLAKKIISGYIKLFDAERLFPHLGDNNSQSNNLLEMLIDFCKFSSETKQTGADCLMKDFQRCISQDSMDANPAASTKNLIQKISGEDLVPKPNCGYNDVESVEDLQETLDDRLKIGLSNEDEVSSEEEQFEEILNTSESDFDQLKVNLSLSDLESNLQKRITQIQHFFALKHKKEVAAEFLYLKECLDLEGDFSSLDIILEQNLLSSERFLHCITEDVIEAIKILGDIETDDLSMITHFTKHQNLIHWLRLNMQNRGEVKVLSDLAMISAGETAMEVDKVSCFLSAVMGFAPLIFDLQENSDLKSMLDAFYKVVERCDHTKLKKQWDATAQYLEWLKGIKDFHGSVEKSSLARAQDINNHGIYVIGKKNEKISTTSNALQLKFGSNRELNSMSLSDLHNLESRLMLIAGEAEKGLNDVKVFTELLSLVESLSRVYVKLKSAGCLLFYGWSARVKFNVGLDEPDSSANFIEVHFDDHSPSIFCRDRVKEELKQLTDVMESIYLRWNKNLVEKRQKFYHLNYFNIQQIMYLCKELAKVTESSDIPNQVFTLLEYVKPDVKKSEIVDLILEVTKFSDEEEVENDNIAEDVNQLSDLEQKQKMVKNLIDAEVSERLAKAAVQACADEDGLPLDYDTCYMKALELETEEYDEDDNSSQLVEKFDTETGFNASSSQVAVIQSVVSDQSSKTLHNVICDILNYEAEDGLGVSVAVKTVGERYLTETAVTSLSDCISIEHLGILLQNLSGKAGKKLSPIREFPPGLEQGKPNLVICPEIEMFPTLLSIYVSSMNERLPSLSEVLLCSETTSRDEVELFLRRAIARNYDTDSCIYCLASTEKLSFEVSNATENMIKQLEKETESNPKYRLVVLCSSVQHYIASLLYENRVDYVGRVSLDRIQKYIANHMPLHSDLIRLRQRNHFELETSTVVVTSNKAGLGKSLHVQRCRDRLPSNGRSLTVRFLNKNLDENIVMNRLLPAGETIDNASSHFLHFDITPSVQFGVSDFLFKLIILGGFSDDYGTLWRRYPNHFYILEYTNSFLKKEGEKENLTLEHSFFNMLPTFRCLSPREIIDLEEQPKNALLMDLREFESDLFQRSYQYLRQYEQGRNLDTFTYGQVEGSPPECIRVLLAHCSLSDPSWSELRHFASFLSSQLSDCEKSVFCNPDLVGPDSGLSGFKNFVVRFMIRMSQDFATPSLAVSNYSASTGEDVFEHHQLRRKWEEDVHPYLFFNEDHVSLTFFNFSVDAHGSLLHPKQPTLVLDSCLIPLNLLQGLKRQGVKLNQNFDFLPRRQKLVTLCRIMGLNEQFVDDPDPSYELTTDNVLKILAIYMRFRCGIPVVIMGETGCGKTRMVEFMSNIIKVTRVQPILNTSKDVNASEPARENIQNMVVVKVHGGITVSMIQSKMRKAAQLAEANMLNHNINTMLFLDEANTTEAIYAIKEYVCDKTINGEAVNAPGLQIICACNPYRKHTTEAVKKMAEAGLGFRVKTEDTTDKLGSVPMRCLVYRVIALPPSMQPLVWDFGQLSDEAEKVYIQQMVAKLPLQLPADTSQLLVALLSASQEFMRRQRSQCLFVSLRDVERCLLSFQWFYKHKSWLYDLIKENSGISFESFPFPQDILRTLIQAIGMCYYVTLEEREPYRHCVSECFRNFGCALSPNEIEQEITACQTVFSSNLNLDENIACNEALRENSFMIAMCTEMRIPLFLIGKPGSSKSLAKTVVTDAMQGTSSRSKVFQELKQIHVLSFQCSAVSDAVGIEAVFTQCAQVQAKQDAEKFVSVVVLDEVGLAEDSPKMPLKVLHPLLEGSSISDDDEFVKRGDGSVEGKRVGFVGISNWALDPAKMNRGIFVIRGDPSENDLLLTAKGIFSSDAFKFKEVDKIVKLLTDSYLDIRKEQDQEFFGLRDYYGLLKMIFSIVKKDDVDLDNFHIANAIKRNFSGGQIDSFKVFLPHLQTVWPDAKESTLLLKTMIRDNLQSVNNLESRFLLLLTNRFAAVTLLDKVVDSRKFQVIFGSSFPRDNDYTELCRNINKIKICMESGITVVLLNLRDLYESLYDALNQHYVTFAGQRYVDLGLGGHRVKCRISKEFRLIVIEDKKVVYEEFPIPLINRLEKYLFTSESVLNGDELQVSSRVNEWITRFSLLDIPMHERRKVKQFATAQCFPGYREDSSASAVLLIHDSDDTAHCYAKAQRILLNTATIDSVFRLQRSLLKKEAEKLQQLYLFHQSHDNLVSFLKSILVHEKIDHSVMNTFVYEITSFSQILGEHDRQKMEKALELPRNSIMLLTLQQFQTQEDYNSKLEFFFDSSLSSSKLASDSKATFILFIQCPQAPKHGNLIACARYSLKNMILQKITSSKEELSVSILIAFLYSMDRQSGNSETDSTFSFNSCDFTSVFLDELRPSVDYIGPPSRFWNKSIGEVFSQSLKTKSQTKDSLTNFADSNFLMDSIKLVQSCIPAAMVKVTSTAEKSTRNRVQLLHLLFNSAEIPVSKPFQLIILQRISIMLTDRDRNLVGRKSQWSVQEACLQENLYEAGTFSKTLWLRLKKILQLCLAKVVSVIDEDDNLDILFQNNPSILDFWLTTFENTEVCKVTTTALVESVREFKVKGQGKFSCQFPFSRRIAEWFGPQWDFVQSLFEPGGDGGDGDQHVQKFLEKVAETSFGSKLESVFSKNPLQVAELFINDLINIHSEVSSVEKLEIELLKVSMKSIYRARFSAFSNNNYLAIAYNLFANKRQFFSQIHCIFEILPSLLTPKNISKWISKQELTHDFITHCLVYHDALSYLEENSSNFSRSASYSAWKSTVRKVLSLKVDLRSYEAKWKVQNKRDSIAFVDLFLSVLVPEGLPERRLENYLGILGLLSKRLGKGASIKGLTDPTFLKIVMDILRNCTRDLHLKLVLSWNNIACKLCHKPKMIDPVILPCKHCFCKKCIELATLSRVHECPICRVQFPDDFILSVAQLPPENVEEFETFKRSCTSFFLQYLSTLCFPTGYDTTPSFTVNEAVWTTLQNLVICERNTRELTPINMKEFDDNPTIRSFILQLLLRYHRESTEQALEVHFRKMEDVLVDLKDLMLMFVRCVEDCLQVQANNARRIDEQNYLDFVEDLISNVTEEHLNNEETKNQVKVLNLVANLRFIMKTTSASVHALHSDSDSDDVQDGLKDLVQSVCEMLDSCDLTSAKRFFVKILCRRYGFNEFQMLLDENEFLSLIPNDLNPSDIDASVTLKSSMFLLGESYKRSLSSLILINSENDFEVVLNDLGLIASQSSDDAVQVFHAICFWINSSCDDAVSLQKEFLDKFTDSLDAYNVEKKTSDFFDILMPNSKLSLWSDAIGLPEGSFHILHEFFIVTGSTIASSSDATLHDLQRLITKPSSVYNYFLPTMPQSGFFDVKNIVRTWIDRSHQTPPKAYKCPNGHVYFIADCTNPNASGICPHCKKAIGGTGSGKLQPGNTAGELDESSQAGYLLGPPSDRLPHSVPERNCSRLVVCTIRMFLHAALLHACENGDHIMIHLKQNTKADTKRFLFQHLQIDFNQLLDCLEKSAEDVSLLLHQILKNIRLNENTTCSHGSTLTTMNGRKIWEDDFARIFLLPVFEKADEIIDQARTICWSNQTENDLERIVFEIPMGDDEERNIADEINVETGFLWNYQVNVNVSNLRQKLEGMSTQENAEGKVLKMILNETGLELIQYLPAILALQQSLIQRYQGKFDANDVEEIRIRDFCIEDEATISSESFQLYFDVWNKVRKTLSSTNVYNMSEEVFQREMDMSSPISMCLPSKVGRGQCALLMDEYLIEKQNDLLIKCNELMTTKPVFSEISVDQLSKDDLICIDGDESLMPIILSNSQYEVTKGITGTKHKIVYWIPALEKQVIEKFIQNNKLLDKSTLPQIRYLQDMGLGAECQKMMKNVPQVPLPHKISQKLNEICSKSRLADICEGVRTLALVMSYLAKLESSPDKLLISYVTDDLMMAPEEASILPKSAQLRHTMALYERMSLERSLLFCKNGQDPFAHLNIQVPELNEEDEDFVQDSEIERALEQIDLPRLQYELNSLILLEDEPEHYSSLRDNLEECMKRKYTDDDDNKDISFIKYLPDKLKVIDAPRLFKLSVHFSA